MNSQNRGKVVGLNGIRQWKSVEWQVVNITSQWGSLPIKPMGMWYFNGWHGQEFNNLWKGKICVKIIS
jgi:hypothetical protein